MQYIFAVTLFGISHLIFVNGFNVGVKGTACSLEAGGNNPCGSLYDAICDGAHCKCPPGSTEDKALKRCSKSSSSVDSDFDDLPFEYDPNQKGNTRPTTRRTTTTTIRPRAPQQPRQPPQQPGQSGAHDSDIAEKTGGGVGGGIGLIVLIGLIYFCCCRGGKGKNFLSKLPFGRSQGATISQPGGQQMQHNVEQQIYVPQEAKADPENMDSQRQSL